MSTYAQFRPSGFDAKGLGLPDRQDWIVAPVSQTRDSGCLDRSNFRVVLADLGGESDTVEVHRFGHWGPGWFEIILIHPDHAKAVAEWEGALSEYPVASETDFSKLEYEEACAAWQQASIRERVELLQRAHYGGRLTVALLMQARRDDMPSDDNGCIQERLLGS